MTDGPPALPRPCAFLSALPHWCQHRAVVLAAVAPAQRLMDWHDKRPEAEQRPYSATWRPVLAAIWSYAAGDDQSWYPISHALGQFYLSPLSRVEGRETRVSWRTGAPADLIAAIRQV